MSTLIVVTLRLIIPLSIFRWRLAGAIAALVADALDIVLITLLPFDGVWDYHRLDKYLDTYYLTIEMIVAQRWQPLPRWTATALWAYRVAGVAIFEVSDTRWLLLVFPNLFENFYLFHGVLLRFFPGYELTRRRLALWLAVLLAPKLVQEYSLHYKRWLDDVVAVDVIEDVTRYILGWFSDRYHAVLALPPRL